MRDHPINRNAHANWCVLENHFVINGKWCVHGFQDDRAFAYFYGIVLFARVFYADNLLRSIERAIYAHTIKGTGNE
jgi:hypothetical protein